MHPCAPINILQSPSSWQRLDFSFSSKMHEEAVSAYSYFTKSNAKCGLGNVDARTRNKKTSRWGVAVDISSLSKRANAHFLLSSWFTQCQTSRKKKNNHERLCHIAFSSLPPRLRTRRPTKNTDQWETNSFAVIYKHYGTSRRTELPSFKLSLHLKCTSENRVIMNASLVEDREVSVCPGTLTILRRKVSRLLWGFFCGVQV